MAESTGRYLYAIGRGIPPAALEAEAGLGEAPLRVVEHRGLSAVVSDVDLEEYGEEGLRRNLEDLRWLEYVARTHDAVVRAAAAAGPTAPLRLATVCFDDEQVRRRIDEWHDALERALDRVEGRVEWSVKAYVPDRVVPAGVPVAAATGPGAGAAYLRRRKEETVRRQQADEVVARDADDLYDALAASAVAGRRLRPQDPRLTQHAGTMTLNAAFLVEDGVDFAALVEEAARSRPRLHAESAGPWPAYSFATLEES